jgi:hypothetical protein
MVALVAGGEWLLGPQHHEHLEMAAPIARAPEQSRVQADGRRGGQVEAANYEIRIKGRLHDSLLPVFEGLAVTTEPVETIVYGPIAGQEALHNLLIELQSLGLEVVEFRRLPGQPADPGVTSPPPP